MFYKIIERKRDEWLNSPCCVVSDLISYIERQHKMRDAQIESIKTYLFLKIECKNQPLWELFASGKFNSTNVDDLEVNRATREILEVNPAALALWEYASISDENGNVNSPKIVAAIKKAPDSIDYTGVIKELFFNVTYPDYLFSIPMGAGKTYLMAALIYLNLYFALAEPDNPIFAHNFILFVPSGLKSSIVPSLRDIQNFNPLWILPDPVASNLKSLIQYEWLQESSSASKSNIVKNPNARKISMHTANPNLMGLVAVTNAEKVILDRVDNNFSIDESLLKSLPEDERKEYEATRQANELREQIGKIPGLCVLIDEVHHASDDQKLRKVVNKWTEQSNFNSVLGFSGTPNMDPASRIKITDELSVKCTQYANVVTYYPLINGIGNFLKIPTVRHANLNSTEIISRGLREFFDKYAETVYSNGTSAKVAIYAPKIKDLEEDIYPTACAICAELGINPTESILKYHKGNSDYQIDEDAQFEFSTLDSPTSKKRIILLVGIGREGWNCKSLTGVILSQRNSCPQNMVLQISCRCLREVDNARKETALIWLNKFNADKLNQQLQEQQYTTITEFGGKKLDDLVTLNRYSRMEQLKLPPIDYYQININYNTIETAQITDIGDYLRTYQPPVSDTTVIYTQGFDPADTASESAVGYDYAESANYRLWFDSIVKESLGLLDIETLTRYEAELKSIFNKIIVVNGDTAVYNNDLNQAKVRSDIRNCFATRRRFNISEELMPEKASLLKVNALKSPIEVSKSAIYSPSQKKVAEIINQDSNPVETISEEVRRYLIEHGSPLPDVEKSVNDRTYHYLPYHLDSSLEDDYLNSIIGYLKSKESVEFYFNGDDTLTDFCIRCYTKRGKVWKLDGNYYPDFLMLTRNSDNTINKVIIIETKGEGFAGKFVPRKQFMEESFIKLNNDKIGYPRFDFLYIEDTLTKEERLQKTINKINTFLLNE
ncbi:DEAD/DEAH box helicase family protein [Muribaculum intestinale]|uniref:DEAD/DEAH box helicase family protein n=1 Tax=Muribaculum intestinale TaxID=1796646 RepID=UPI0025A99816|nr:DEAD/DEAH box helicase family protein [Muribaculum intestinale]